MCVSQLSSVYQRSARAVCWPWVIWGDRDMIDLQGHTKILKVAGRKLCPIIGH